MASFSTSLRELFSRRPTFSELQLDNKIVGPDFICFGMQKAGTRWLFDQMNARSDVWMPPIKEINYFTKACLKIGNKSVIDGERKGTIPVIERPYDKMRMNLFIESFGNYKNTNKIDWYKRLFSFKGERISGDITPNYGKLNSDQVSAAVKDLPDTRFIFLIREPVDRLWSGASMYVRQNRISAAQITDWATLKPLLSKGGFASNSFPSSIWTRWSDVIPADRIRFWFFDDIVREPAKVVDEICDYLGIKPGPGALPANFNRKQANEKIPMPDDVRQRLQEHFADELDRCVRIFGGHAMRWRDAAMTSGND